MKKYSKEIQIRRKDLCPIGYKMNQLTNSIEIDEVKATEIRNMFNTLAYEEPLSDEDTYLEFVISIHISNNSKLDDGHVVEYGELFLQFISHV